MRECPFAGVCLLTIRTSHSTAAQCGRKHRENIRLNSVAKRAPTQMLIATNSFAASSQSFDNAVPPEAIAQASWACEEVVKRDFLDIEQRKNQFRSGRGTQAVAASHLAAPLASNDPQYSAPDWAPRQGCLLSAIPFGLLATTERPT